MRPMLTVTHTTERGSAYDVLASNHCRSLPHDRSVLLQLPFMGTDGFFAALRRHEAGNAGHRWNKGYAIVEDTLINLIMATRNAGGRRRSQAEDLRFLSFGQVVESTSQWRQVRIIGMSIVDVELLSRPRVCPFCPCDC